MWLVLINMLACISQKVLEFRRLFPYRKTSDGNTGQVQGIYELRTLLPEMFEYLSVLRRVFRHH